MTEISFNLTGTGEPERIDGQRVSGSLFQLLGVEPQLGRAFLPEEDRAGANHVVILSHGLWQRRFGSDPAIISRPINLDGQSFTVVGVMPKGFQFPSRTDQLWVPIAFTANEAGQRGNHYLEVIARMKPGTSLEQAQAEMTTIATRLQQQYPQTNTSIGAVITPLHEHVVGNIKPALLVLLVRSRLFFLSPAQMSPICCWRAPPFVKRRSRCVLPLARAAPAMTRQFLTESVLLAALGGGCWLWFSRLSDSIC